MLTKNSKRMELQSRNHHNKTHYLTNRERENHRRLPAQVLRFSNRVFHLAMKICGSNPFNTTCIIKSSRAAGDTGLGWKVCLNSICPRFNPKYGQQVKNKYLLYYTCKVEYQYVDQTDP